MFPSEFHYGGIQLQLRSCFSPVLQFDYSSSGHARRTPGTCLSNLLVTNLGFSNCIISSILTGNPSYFISNVWMSQLCFSDSGIANCICKLTSNMLGNLWGDSYLDGLDRSGINKGGTLLKPWPSWILPALPRLITGFSSSSSSNLPASNPDKSLVPSDAWYGPSDLDRWTLWSSRDLLARDLDWTYESSPGELTTGALPTEATAKCNSLEPLDGFSAMVGTNHSDFQWVIGVLAITHPYNRNQSAYNAWLYW